MVGVIGLFSYRHCQAYWFTLIILVIGEHIFPGIGFLQDASLRIVNINLTLSHSQVA